MSHGQGTETFNPGSEEAEGQSAQEDKRVRADGEVAGSQSESLMGSANSAMLRPEMGKMPAGPKQLASSP